MTKEFPVGVGSDGVSVILLIDSSHFLYWLQSFYLLTDVIFFIDSSDFIWPNDFADGVADVDA